MSDLAESVSRRMPGWQKALMLILIACGFVFVYMVMFWHPVKRQELPEPRRSSVAEYTTAPQWRDPPPRAEPPTSRPPPATAPAPSPLASILPTGPRQADPAQLARESPILGPQSQASAPQQGEMVRPHQAEAADNTPLAVALRPTRMQGSRASRMAHPELTIVQGAKIPCIVENAFSTDQIGMVTCNVPIDVRGFAGHVILLPAGTHIVGQSQSGMRQGSRRTFVVWTRAYTPEGVVIDLDSPAADALGRAGLEGDLNTHFWERFGGALMLSFVDSGLQAAAMAASSGSGNSYFNSFQSNGQSVANTALGTSINIPPTLERDQGLPAIVFVARDLDFSSVYALEMRPSPTARR